MKKIIKNVILCSFFVVASVSTSLRSVTPTPFPQSPSIPEFNEMANPKPNKWGQHKKIQHGGKMNKGPGMGHPGMGRGNMGKGHGKMGGKKKIMGMFMKLKMGITREIREAKYEILEALGKDVAASRAKDKKATKEHIKKMKGKLGKRGGRGKQQAPPMPGGMEMPSFPNLDEMPI
ncbi:hypothetical protein HOD08_04255 [bacterium]|nr:hypothetical protein [bacterium]